MLRRSMVVLAGLAIAGAACSGADSGTAETTSTSAGDTTTSAAPGGSAGADLWTTDACTLLTDDEVAALAGGAPSEAQSGGGSVAAEDYGGASCRWKVSSSQFVTLDVYPTTADSLDDLAAYNPWDRWTVETYSEVGDDARLVIATGEGAGGLETAGTIQAIVIEEGGTGVRIAYSTNYPASPDALVTGVEQILAQR